MNNKQLEKIKKNLKAMHRSPQGKKASDFESIAQSLGRTLVKRGKEPNWQKADESPILVPPLSIPHHGAEDLKVGTARNIIQILLNDVDTWETYLQTQEQKSEEDE
ncbi:MAG TPA: hypothetical protein VGJ90_06945 [Methylophilaceae bacterium]